jgi:hypothetical protein
LAQHLSPTTRRRRRVVASIAVAVVALAAVGVVVIRSQRHDGRTKIVSTAEGAGGTSKSSGAPASTTTDPKASTPATATPAATVPPVATTKAPTVPAVLSTAAVRRYLAGRSGNISAAVINLATGATSLWRPGVEEDTASIVKVDILATLLHEDQVAHTALSEEDGELATGMIEDSNNDDATDLWDDVGQNTAIAAFDRLVPLTATVPGTDGYWGLTTTTAADQAALVRELAVPGNVLDTASRQYELGLMDNVEASERWGVTGGIPAGVPVALKNGWLPLDASDDNHGGGWQVNSIGWVHGDGRNYVLAVLTNGSATEGYGIDTIEGLSSLVWAHLAA